MCPFCVPIHKKKKKNLLATGLTVYLLPHHLTRAEREREREKCSAVNIMRVNESQNPHNVTS